MRNIKKITRIAVFTIAAVTLSNFPVLPGQGINSGVITAEAATSLITGLPTTKAAASSLSGTLYLERYSKGVTLGSVRLTPNSQIVISMPTNSNKDLMQGKITLIPIGSGTSKSYQFTNLSLENWTISLSDITSGTYMVKFDPTVYGTSNKATFIYRIG